MMGLSRSCRLAPALLLLLSVGVEARDETREPIDWLHVEKTGTSIMKAIALYKCEDELLEHYGKDDNLVFWHLFFNFSKSERGKRCTEKHDMSWKAGHGQLRYKTGLGHFGFEIDAVVSMFRKPFDRTASYFVQRRNSTSCASLLSGTPTTEQEDFVMKYNERSKGCMARSITGQRCFPGGKVPFESEKAMLSRVDRANHKIDRMGFVGLTENWAQSMCIFSKKYPRPSGRPYPADMSSNVRPSKSYSCRDVVEGIMTKREFKDPTDEAVYAHAVKRFNRELEWFPECKQVVESESGKGEPPGSSSEQPPWSADFVGDKAAVGYVDSGRHQPPRRASALPQALPRDLEDAFHV